VHADVHRPSTYTTGTALKSRKIKSLVTVPQYSSLAYTPGKEQHKPSHELTIENDSSNNLEEKPRKGPKRSTLSSQHTQRHARFVDNDVTTTSTSRRHGDHASSSDDDGSSTESSDNEQHGKTDKQRQTKRSSKRHKWTPDNGSDLQTTSTAGKQHKTTCKKYHRRQSSSTDATHERSTRHSCHDNNDLTNKDTSRHSSHHQPTDLTQDMEQRARTRTRRRRHSSRSSSSSSSDGGSKRPGKDKHSKSKNKKKSNKTPKSSPDKRKDGRNASDKPTSGRKDGDLSPSPSRRNGERSPKSDGSPTKRDEFKESKPQKRDLGKKTTEVNVLTPILTDVTNVDVHRRDTGQAQLTNVTRIKQLRDVKEIRHHLTTSQTSHMNRTATPTRHSVTRNIGTANINTVIHQLEASHLLRTELLDDTLKWRSTTGLLQWRRS